MEAIILAGGLGTRLRKIVPNLPKPMAPVNGKPFLEILLNTLYTKGFNKAIISTGYKAEIIISHFGNNFKGISLEYTQEDMPLGTGGGVRLALEKCHEDHVYIFNGDTFLDIRIDEIEALWNKTKTSIIIGAVVNDAARYGSLIIENNRVTGFSEKGLAGKGVINAGCYVFDPKLILTHQINTKFSLEEDLLRPLINKGGMNVYISNGKFIDIGVPDDFIRAGQFLAEF
jgi:D-glycero-alpha-D-manno-heptose 1-phosphate guanylyltransferase